MKVGTNWKGFTIGHRIPWHEKCGRMHGHSLRVRVIVDGDVDAATGMVVDFGVLGDTLAGIVGPLDHKFLAPQSARYVEGFEFLDEGKPSLVAGPSYVIDGQYVLPERDVMVMPMDIVSTENLASWFLSQLGKERWVEGKTVTVQVSETGDNIAEASQYFEKKDWKLPAYWNTQWTSTATTNMASTGGGVTTITIPAFPPGYPIVIL
jgi:6-pyruvoyltetrahydropterin/6-carboxytetrahydropterin synthase